MSKLGTVILSKIIEKNPKGSHIRKTHMENLAVLTETVLNIRSVNTSEIAAAIPRNLDRQDMREQWVLRTLGNKKISCVDVIEPYIREIFEKISTNNKKIVICIDQTHINRYIELLVVGVHFLGRALPLICKASNNKGNIGFEEQAKLLNTIDNLSSTKI